MGTFTKEVIEAAISGFEAQKQHIDDQIAELRRMLPSASGPASSPVRTTDGNRRTMSAAGRRAIAEAQRKRWAAKKGEAAEVKPAKKAKRRLSAAGRAAIVAALKKRWAAKKAQTSNEAAPGKRAARKKVA